jgi:hypothetical protein
MVCAISHNGNIDFNPQYIPPARDEKEAIAVAKLMADNEHNKTFAAVSFTIASAYRAEPVETKTVKYEVRQVR